MTIPFHAKTFDGGNFFRPLDVAQVMLRSQVYVQ
jgi:hypothetical protein